uniref:Tetraspanin n=1 Tax=Oncorhynchus kisutch TaxID=8019 RepID=A0A8C7LHS0_ONCKI
MQLSESSTQILGLCIFGCAVWILFDKDNFIAVLSSGKLYWTENCLLSHFRASILTQMLRERQGCDCSPENTPAFLLCVCACACECVCVCACVCVCVVEVKTVAGGLFIIGLVVVGVTILGCMGAQLENRCFLLLYMGFLICLVLGQLFVTFIVLLNHGKITSKMKIEVDKIITEYGTNPDNQRHWKLLDNVQRYGHCCGMQSPNDWQSNMFIKNNSLIEVYPCSCFNTTDCPAISGFSTLLFGNGSETQIHPQRCVDIITNWLKENTLTIVGMEVGLLISQVTHRHTDTQTHRHTGTQAHRHTDTQTHRHTGTQTHRHTDTQAHRHTGTQTHRHTDTQTHRHTDTQTHRHMHTQTHRHTDTQTHRHTDTQTHRHTDTQAHRHTDTQTHRHMHTHTQTQTHAHTRTHTDTQTHSLLLLLLMLNRLFSCDRSSSL